ncbi:MAG: alkaline phosphatase family protein [Nitrospinota bacterium]
MGFLFLFIDGIGVAAAGEQNPFTLAEASVLAPLGSDERGPVPFGGLLKPLDATLGVPGLPQSATGGTSLFTGVNAARLLGRHLQGMPHERLRALIREKGLLGRALAAGRSACFANAYTPRFFDPNGRTRHSVTTVLTLSAGLPLMTLDDLRAGRALDRDFTNGILIERGYEVEALSPEEAGVRLARIAPEYDLLLYEYFETDMAGHGRNMAVAVKEVKKLDRFLLSLLCSLDLERTSVILTSDHGNLEDMSSHVHTRNPVPLFLWGAGGIALAPSLSSIVHVTPALVQALRSG